RHIIIHWEGVIALLGKPQEIKTDNGPCFVARRTKEWCALWDIKLVHGLPYNSQGQAIVEHAHHT
ncbi:POK18 protein, partial [Ciccaba nigrolineata]|nr:POK18 protein [Ciccaba nigrolineata]